MNPRLIGKIGIRARTFFLERRILLPYRERFRFKETAGTPLIIGAIIAIVWANSVLAPSYHALWDSTVTIDFHILTFEESLRRFINDLLLPLFFLAVGLDIKREIAFGHLSRIRTAALPIAMASGGIALPAMLYLFINMNGDTLAGWGVPIATDVAFCLAILALLGDRIPAALKVLAMAFAAADDVGGVLAIAVFYSDSITLSALGLAACVWLLIAGLIYRRVVASYLVYISLGLLFAAAVYASGVHMTIAGVLLGLVVPASSILDRKRYKDEVANLAHEFEELETQRERLQGKEELAAVTLLYFGVRLHLKNGRTVPTVCLAQGLSLRDNMEQDHDWTAQTLYRGSVLARQPSVCTGGF